MDLLVVMAKAAEDTEQAAIDPTVLAVLSIFGGVAVTALAGLLGAWIQSRREHSRWVRERRYEAYAKMLTLHNELQAAEIRATNYDSSDRSEAEEILAQRKKVIDDLPAVAVPLAILGPAPVSEASDVLFMAVLSGDTDARESAEETLLTEIHRALGVKH